MPPPIITTFALSPIALTATFRIFNRTFLTSNSSKPTPNCSVVKAKELRSAYTNCEQIKRRQMAELPTNARVVIVGGGIVGCSVAY
ncbi:MAG: hypothetical protein EBS27_04980, partial [Actinobacteria bacterium]|nr:hypothetical protein [Actinomycetota bacterium]